ncbi:MAG: S8 family serine peptidase [Bacteroidota bacterium]
MGDTLELVAPVYMSGKSGLEGAFAVRPDVLVLEAETAEGLGRSSRGLLRELGFLEDEGRTRYLTNKVVFRSQSPKNDAGLELATRLRRYGDVKEVYFEKIPLYLPLCSVLNDPLYGNAWHLRQIQWAPELVGCNHTTVIAVIDQGVELTHPDLSLASPGLRLDVMALNGSPTGNHGTPCAGIAAGIVNNSEGISGVAGKAQIFPLAVRYWSDLEIANGINYAAAFGADVISMSFGVYDSWNYWDYGLIDPEIVFADNQGTFMCAATGNENRENQMRYPAKHPLVLAVGGSNRDDRRKAQGDTSSEPFWGACYGEEIYRGSPTAINVVAPCLEIPATDRLSGAGYSPDDYFLTFNGTSSATPIVAGLGALIKARYSFAGNSTVKRIIEKSADKIGPYAYVYRPEYPNSSWSSEVGHGRVNVRRALKLAREMLSGYGSDCATDTPASVTGSPVIAFSVVGKGHVSEGPEKQLLEFSHVHLNEGGGFSPDVFRVPVDGVYEFNWDFVRDTLYQEGTEDDVSIYLKVNGQTISGPAFAGQIFDKYARATGTASLILRLVQDDKVKLFVNSDNEHKRHILSFHWIGHRIG